MHLVVEVQQPAQNAVQHIKLATQAQSGLLWIALQLELGALPVPQMLLSCLQLAPGSPSLPHSYSSIVYMKMCELTCMPVKVPSSLTSLLNRVAGTAGQATCAIGHGPGPARSLSLPMLQ